MSRGDLQEMEVGTKQSKTAVNAKAGAADAMDTSVAGSYEDLGGPTPDNYKPDDDSAKLKTPGGSLKQVKDVVNKGAAAAEAGKGMKEEEELDTESVVEEDQEVTDEVVAEEETAEEEVVAEEETTEEEAVEEEVVAEYDIEEDVNALLQGEELSEEFQEKARTIFETAITAKVAEVKEALEARYSEVLAEEVEDIKKELNERVDSYLEYVAEEWYTENQLAVEAGLKAEMTESFLTGMKSLFEEHYVTIPEEKYDVLESMVEKLDDMETKLNEQIEKNVSLNKRLAESVADGIVDQVSEGLAKTQKEKLASLAESVEFESENQYREKLETLKESYFPSKGVSPSAKKENLSEGVDSSPETVNGSMAAYLKTLSSFSK
tara:strand:+ start:4469 stop:5602 length:1134 start_codon:yes stop_codon:yes gene_type:complete